MHEHIKTTVDGVSVGISLATLAGWLPILAAFASLVWTLIRIYESKTVQKFLNRHNPNYKPDPGASDES